MLALRRVHVAVPLTQHARCTPPARHAGRSSALQLLMRADVAFARSLAAALLLICAVLCTFVSAAPSYDIGDARLTVSSFDGAARLTREFKSSAAVPATPETLAVEPDLSLIHI